jgi:hypothetical protein
MNNISKNDSILILDPVKLDATKVNAFANFNTRMISKNFSKSQVFYFLDSVIANGIKATENEIKRIIDKKGISLVFFMPNGNSYELPVEFFASLKNDLNVKNVLWVLDDEIIFDTLSKFYLQVFDAAVTCDYYATFAYEKLGIPALYYFSSYSKDDLFPVDIDKTIDISFVGDCKKVDRMEYINYLIENGINVYTFGKGSKDGFLKKESLSQIFSKSKINLNFTKTDKFSIFYWAWFLEENPLVNLVRQNKSRPMEIAMTNSFCLSEYSSSLGKTFEIGKELDIFYDKEDLLKKVKYYLKNDDIRAKIANNAYEKATTVYEADIFIPKLLSELCDILNNFRQAQRDPIIYKDRLFKQNHIYHLTIDMFKQIHKLKLKSSVETFINLFQYGSIIFLSSFSRGLKRLSVQIFLKICKNKV